MASEQSRALAAPLDTTDAPNEDAELLVRAIAASRDQALRNLDALQSQLRDRLDVAEWIREHPWEAVGTAFIFGLVVGARPYL